MKKIVINRSYGGFGLSQEALEWLKENSEDLSPYIEYCRSGRLCFYDADLFREHPDLIAVVETLGSEEASGDHSSLKIVEIPEDIEYVIEEYDGKEKVCEKHLEWW